MNTQLSNDQRLSVSRRELLRTIAATGAGALLSSGRGIAQTNPRRIDVHHHFQPPVDGNAGLKWWTPEKSIEMMDKFGIAFAMMNVVLALAGV